MKNTVICSGSTSAPQPSARNLTRAFISESQRAIGRSDAPASDKTLL